MTQTVFNTMLTILLAKWALNDIPHSLGVMEPPGWEDLLHFTDSKHIWLREAVVADVREHNVTPQALQDYKTVMGGYYLIATENATVPNYVVENMYRIIKRGIIRQIDSVERAEGVSLNEFVRILRREEGVPEDTPITYASAEVGYLGAVERLLWARMQLKDGSRADKVIAIDGIISMVHDEGSYMVWIVGQGIRNGEIESITPDVLEALFKG